MSELAILPLLIPLVAGALLFIVGGARRGLERAIGLTASVALLALAGNQGEDVIP